MNKYDILEGKLTAINAYIDTMCLESNATMEYLKQYKEYVNELIIAIQNRTIRNSNGAVMGLIRGVSDYDELCADDTFWQLVTDADNYYCNECYRTSCRSNKEISVYCIIGLHNGYG